MLDANEGMDRDWPAAVLRALQQTGANLRDARRRRRISTMLMAQRAAISRSTLNKVEKGDPTVAMGTYATVLFVLGLTDRLAELADVRFDRLGQTLAEEQLPQRIRTRRQS